MRKLSREEAKKFSEEIDWSKFSPDDVLCSCSITFRSATKIVNIGNNELAIISEHPCPSCESLSGFRKISSRSEIFEIGKRDIK